MNTKEINEALAPLSPLLQDPDVQEIMVDAPDRVMVERRSQIEKSSVQFASSEAVRAAIDAALALGGAAFKEGETVCSAHLSDGTRVLGVLPPTAQESPYLVLRKFFTRDMTWEKLHEYGAVSSEIEELLMGAIQAPVNILVTGGTGSGKTTMLNLLGERIPQEDRIIVVGDTDLPVNHPRRIQLRVNPQVELSTTDLLVTAAKMRPDWLLFGEVHGAEAIHLVQLLATGFSGMTSMHANSVEHALTRLEAMCLMANLGLGLAEIRTEITAAFGLITCQRKLPNGKRRLVEITELLGVENNRYILQPLARFDVEKDRYERTPAKASWE